MDLRRGGLLEGGYEGSVPVLQRDQSEVGTYRPPSRASRKLRPIMSRKSASRFPNEAMSKQGPGSCKG